MIDRDTGHTDCDFVQDIGDCNHTKQDTQRELVHNYFVK